MISEMLDVGKILLSHQDVRRALAYIEVSYVHV